MPNLRRGLLAAAFITVAVVLGEYTIASLLNRVNLQTALVQVCRSDPYVAVIFALLALAVRLRPARRRSAASGSASPHRRRPAAPPLPHRSQEGPLVTATA